MLIEIPYTRRQRAKDFDNNEQRRNVLVLHRRAWKSTHMINKLIKKCLTKPFNPFPDWVHWYIAPTYKQAKSIIREQAKFYSRFIPWIDVNESELKVIYPNNHILRLFGADNPDSLRGLKYWDVVFDEYAQQPSNIFSEIIRPWLSDTKWGATWIWTPKGQNAFYDLYEWATKDNWYRMILRADLSWIIDDEELEDCRWTMTDEEFRQEYLCDFTASVKGAYYSAELNKAYKEMRVIAGLFDKVLPVYTFWDLWMADYTAILFVQIHWNQIRIIDSYESHWQGLEHYYKICEDRGYYYKEHRFPHDIMVKELWTWQTRYEIVKKMFWWLKCKVSRNISIIDWINASKMMFQNVWFDEEKTKDFRNALSNYRQERDDKKWVYKDNPLHDRSSHYADAFRYLWVMHKWLTDSLKRSNIVAITPDYNLY